MRRTPHLASLLLVAGWAAAVVKPEAEEPAAPLDTGVGDTGHAETGSRDTGITIDTDTVPPATDADGAGGEDFLVGASMYQPETAPGAAYLMRGL